MMIPKGAKSIKRTMSPLVSVTAFSSEIKIKIIQETVSNVFCYDRTEVNRKRSENGKCFVRWHPGAISDAKRKRFYF